MWEYTKLLIKSNQRLGEERRAEFVFHSPSVQLVHVLGHVNGFLDFTNNKDAGEHLLQLFFWDWLSWVPDGAIWSHHGLRCQVEGVITTFSTLWTERDKEDMVRTFSGNASYNKSKFRFIPPLTKKKKPAYNSFLCGNRGKRFSGEDCFHNRFLPFNRTAGKIQLVQSTLYAQNSTQQCPQS